MADAKPTEKKPAPAKAEQKAAPSDSGTEATEENDEELKTDSESDGTDAESVAEVDKPKKKGGFQRRIDKLNAAKADAQRERDFWREEAMKHAPKNAARSEAPIEPPARNEHDEPQPEQFDNYKSYVKAMTAWTVKDEARKAERAVAKTRVLDEQKKIHKTHVDRVSAFAAKTDDFEEQLSNLDDVHGSAALAEVIMTSDHGPEILYELAKNPDEARRIVALSPLAVARELGKIESRFSKAPSAEAEEPEPRKLTKAPKPLEPVTAKSGSATKSIFDPNISQADYERLRRKQRSADG